MKALFLNLTFILGLLFAATAQEQLVPLSTYPALKNNKADITKENTKAQAEAVKLPFADDFSYNSIYPDKRLWANRYVFVNKGFAENPYTLGVATFDAVNDTGGVYSYASQFPFIADSLTSMPIRLDSVFGAIPKAIFPDDSVYISFWIQPQGKGNAPEEQDSLILQFYNPVKSVWKTVWNHQGMKLDSFRTKYGSDFKQFLVAITDSDYFSPEFRFRFLNKASIPNNNIPSWRSGLYDQWNLDYVYIDADRSYKDTSVFDVAFIESANTLLNNYVSMPWNQYQANAAAETNTSMKLKFKNFDYVTNVKNMNMYFHITDLNTKQIVKKSAAYPSSNNMTPGQIINYAPSYGSFTFQNSGVKYPDFEVIFRILTNTPPADIIRVNDTVRFYQKFYNYYAYDDGIPEAGYGLSAAQGRLACKFTLNTGDSLQAVQMYFNQTLGLSSQQYFYLTVWDDNNGQPGNVIYEQMGLRPEYESNLFKYYTYKLKHAVYLPAGTFYVGWRQTTGDNLNIGFDKNNDRHSEIFYNTSGSWSNSSFAGALMIRPVLGNDKTAWVGIKEKSDNKEINPVIYPNPVTGGIVYLNFGELSRTQKDNIAISLYSADGKLVMRTGFSNELNVGNLAKGLYFIRIITDDSKPVTRKIIIR